MFTARWIKYYHFILMYSSTKSRCVFHVASTFLSGNPFVYMPALLLHLRLSGLPREPRERLISPSTEKSDGDNAALTQTEAFDQKATHTHTLSCLFKTRSEGLCCLPPALRREQPVVGGCGVCLERRSGQFDLLSGDSFQT